VKLRSVRELKAWIAAHVRFDTAADHLPLDLPETAERLREAEAEAAKVVHITHEGYVQPDVREGGKVLGPRSWKRADGQPDRFGEPSKPCEHAVLGLVVAGRGRGEAFDVCTAKKKCRVHWAQEMRAAQQAAKQSAADGTPAAPAKPQESPWERQERERKAFAAKVAAVREPLLTVFAAAIKKAPTKPGGALEQWVLADHLPRAEELKAAARYVPRGRTGDDFMRWVACAKLVAGLANSWSVQRSLTQAAKLFGVDVKAILKGGAGKPAATARGPKAAAKKTRKAS
jgi:hypothetical protein